MIALNTPERLARFCQCMAVVTCLLIATMLLFNTLCWYYPKLALITTGYGMEFSLTDRLIFHSGIDITLLPWWQRAGGIILSGLPLLALISSLYALYRLFQLYGRREYFSSSSAVWLGKTGHGMILWLILSILSEPFLMLWLTQNERVGQRIISLSFTSSYAVALFLSACIAVIARILHQASELNAENQKFV